MTTLALADADIHYELKGSGLPVLFIQGVGTTGSAWNPQSDALSKDFHCLQFDNRGIGQSTDRGGQLSVEKMAEDTRDLLDAVGWHSAHVVGNSMGGIIAQQLALAAPERVRSLSLLCTFSKGSEGASPTPWAIWMALRTRLGPRAWRRRAFLEMLFPTDYLAQCDKDALAAEIAPHSRTRPRRPTPRAHAAGACARCPRCQHSSRRIVANPHAGTQRRARPHRQTGIWPTPEPGHHWIALCGNCQRRAWGYDPECRRNKRTFRATYNGQRNQLINLKMQLYEPTTLQRRRLLLRYRPQR